MKKRNSGQRGFTLVELIFVLAIIVTLASIFLPLAMSKFSESKEASATSSIDAISAALTSFFGDLDHFPTCDSTDCNPLTSNNNDLKFLAFGTGSGSLTGEYPVSTSGSGSDWDLTTNDSASPERNNAFNHLAVNNPNADGTTGDTATTTGDYSTSKWKGPYIAKIGIDPYGFAFIAHVGTMETNGSKITTTGQGWILSAGPDGVLDTAPNASVLSNDDIGYIFFTK
ncbi:MAG: prepilin-type N-terminal cleavage/methylation domain-containing protein [Deltaproteobacteria bacterium]|nr:prepilin-type N-terminal cleavage/methylation domain-containing protein [Deltaproteobacteria bacterium]